MSPEVFSILLCRAAGLLLLIFGGSRLLPAILWNERAGWSSYAPLQRGFVPNIKAMYRFYLPYVAQALAGIALLLFSRFFGLLLCYGLVGTPA